ncbi:MAG: VCBS domain-containing protein, partial [Hyphomicrobiales bacterium]
MENFRDNSEAVNAITDAEAVDQKELVVAQAEVEPVVIQPEGEDAAPVVFPETVEPDAQNRVVLPDGTSLEKIVVDGRDLLLEQADGSVIRIVGGATSLPTFFLGEIEVPQNTLVAALNSVGLNIAAGPNGSSSVAPAVPQGSGADFSEDDQENSLGDDDLSVTNLLGNTDFGIAGTSTGPIFDEGGVLNLPPVVSGALTTTVAEDSPVVLVDLLTGASDADASDVLGVANATGLVAGVTLVGANLSVDPSDAAFDSLAAGESLVITVSFDVVDGNGGVTPQSATITITGTND